MMGSKRLDTADAWLREYQQEFIREDKHSQTYSYDKNFDYMVWERGNKCMVYLIKKGQIPNHSEGLFLTRLNVVPESKEHLEMMLTYKDLKYV